MARGAAHANGAPTPQKTPYSLSFQQKTSLSGICTKKIWHFENFVPLQPKCHLFNTYIITIIQLFIFDKKRALSLHYISVKIVLWS
jgi:hypothetical protein